MQAHFSNRRITTAVMVKNNYVRDTGESTITLCDEKNRRTLFGDKRLERRGITLVEEMLNSCSVVIRQVGKNNAERKAFYHLIRNKKVTIEALVNCFGEHCNDLLGRGIHVLAINDTTVINLKGHSGRVRQEELGKTGTEKEKSLGFFLHPTLILEANTGQAYGLSSVQIWTRQFEQGNKKERNYQKLRIEEKESYKWIQAAKDTKRNLKDVQTITIVADRESDIYEEFALVPDKRTHLLIRSRSDRSLYGGKEKLYQKLKEQRLAGTYKVQVPAEKRLGREKREAEIEVRFAKVKLQRPATARKELVKYVELYALEARERASTTPITEEGILWRLLTTHRLENFEQGKQVTAWYSERWQVEQLNRVLKKQGLNIEGTELESGKAIMKVTVLGLQVTLKVMQLVTASEGQEAKLAFNEEELTCLKELEKELEGNGEKQKNPHSSQSLLWVMWIIGRLGGWSGYQSQRPAGVITIYRGLKRFEDIFFGWQLACNS